MNILFEDTHYLILSKPQGMPSQKDPTGDLDLCSAAEDYLKHRDHKKTQLYVVHRLDRPVGGIITYAKSKEAASAFNKLLTDRTISKKYLCVAAGTPDKEADALVHYLKKKSGENRSVAVHANDTGAKQARLNYCVLEKTVVKGDALALLEVALDTGRHHQIRVQLATANLPLWGDSKYHPKARRKRNWTNIALWSYALSFNHPFTHEPLSIQDLPPHTQAPWQAFEKLKTGTIHIQGERTNPQHYV